MAVISLDCPHDGCRLEKAAYVIKAFNRTAPVVYECFSTCPGCGRSVVAVINCNIDIDPVNLSGNILEIRNVPSSLHTVFPAISTVDTPDHAPEELHSFYQQGFDSLQRGNWDAAGMMFRKTLERAVKHLHPEGTGTLYNRIENLPDDIGVTPAMKEWAHEIRDIGNESTHDDAETEEDARATYNFTNVFLRYAYTMPGMMNERRGVSDSGDAE